MKNFSAKILILPDAGTENPFQFLIKKALEKSGFRVVSGEKRKIGSTCIAVSRHRPDIIYYDWVHSFIIGKTLLRSLLKSSVFVVEIAGLRFRKIPVFHTIHNLRNHAGKWLLLEKIVYTFFLRNCTHIRVYSEQMKSDATKKFGLSADKIIVAQDPPYHLYYPNQSSKETSRDFLNVNKDTFVFLFFGEIKPYKGLEILIDAFLQPGKQHCRLLIAGKSDNPRYLEQLVRRSRHQPDIVWHHKFIPDEEVQYYFNAADTVVLPFTRIDHSGTVDLSMSFKKPVITLKTPAMHHLLRHQADLLFEEAPDLHACLTRALQSRNLFDYGNTNFEIIERQGFDHFLRLFHHKNSC